MSSSPGIDFCCDCIVHLTQAVSCCHSGELGCPAGSDTETRCHECCALILAALDKCVANLRHRCSPPPG